MNDKKFPSKAEIDSAVECIQRHQARIDAEREADSLATAAQPVEAAGSAVQAEPNAARFERMFLAACADLGLINEELGLDPDDGGADPIIEAIKELKARAATHPAEPASSPTVSAGFSAVDAAKLAQHGAEVLISEKNALIKAHQEVLAERDAEIAKLRAAAVGGAQVDPLDFENWFDEKAFAWEFKKYGPTDAARILWDAARRGLPRPAEPVTDWTGAAKWLRNNYQDHTNIASLCDVMIAAAPVGGALVASTEQKPTDRDAVLEEAAKLCESDDQEYEIGRLCAAAIRALKGKSGSEGAAS